MGLAFVLVTGLAVGGLVVLWQLLHLAIVLSWSDFQTRAARYYSRPLAGRSSFKRLLRLHATLLAPILVLLGAATRARFSRRRIRYAGVSGPAGACSAECFQRAARYQPRPEDVFVVTQMRSGTTWMQHLVYQVVTRASGDLAHEGLTLGAISPWIESIRTVDVQSAPLVGSQRQTRLIKTHLPVPLCPFDRQANYIYVARHPLACFASCADFVRNNLHGFAPPWHELAAWFLSDELMWWSSWPTHVGGWQRRALSETNVLLVRYEDMAFDLTAVAQRVANFLGVPPLASAELASITHKCSLSYMRRHAELFEMYPPHLLQTTRASFGEGPQNRWREVPDEIASQILAACRDQCAASGIPIGELYPELAAQPQVNVGLPACP